MNSSRTCSARTGRHATACGCLTRPRELRRRFHEACRRLGNQFPSPESQFVLRLLPPALHSLAALGLLALRNVVIGESADGRNVSSSPRRYR